MGRANIVRKKVASAIKRAKAATGQSICAGLMPEAFIARSSWSFDIRPNPKRIASKKAIGTVISRKVGRIKENNLTICSIGTPRVTTNSISFKMRPINSTEVNASKPKKNGGMTSEIK